MTVANLKIGRRNFVVVPERDFDRMQSESKRYRQMVEMTKRWGGLPRRN
jgi:hypothetical protein